MTTIKDLLDSKKPSEKFSMTPNALGLEPEAFSNLVSNWLTDGGLGFRVVSTHQESQTGKHLYDFVTLEKL